MDRLEAQYPRQRSPSSRNHRRLPALVVTAVALTAVGCGAGAPSAAHTPTTATPRSGPATAAFVWLRDKAEPWNHALNTDQQAIVAASRTIDESSADDYFSRLRRACQAMLHDAQMGRGIARAPSAGLDGAWEAMLTETETYASDCLTLVQTRSERDLSTWNDSLTAMNRTSGAFNAAVAAVRSGGTGSSG